MHRVSALSFSSIVRGFSPVKGWLEKGGLVNFLVSNGKFRQKTLMGEYGQKLNEREELHQA